MAKQWSPKEMDILKKNYSSCDWEALYNLLPGRTYKGIEKMRSILNLKKVITLEKRIPEYGNKRFELGKEYFDGKRLTFGVVSDPHYLSKHQQLTYFQDAYKVMKKQGCSFILNTGDVTEGNGNHYPGQKQEIFKNMYSDQRSYLIANYPSDLPTYMISGDHDLDWWKGGGEDIIADFARERADISYLGQHASFLNVGGISFYLLHPMGGLPGRGHSAKAVNITSSFQGGTKPQVLLIGHYHQASYHFIRNIHTLFCPCFQSQTSYLIRKALAPDIGFWIVNLTVASDGSITRFQPEIFIYYVPLVNDYTL
jgi:predicted phosphodiesterase